MQWPKLTELKWKEIILVTSVVAMAALNLVTWAFSKETKIMAEMRDEIQSSETRQNLRRDDILRHYVPTEDWLRWQKDNSARLDRNEFTMEKNFLVIMNRLESIQAEVRRR